MCRDFMNISYLEMLTANLDPTPFVLKIREVRRIMSMFTNWYEIIPVVFHLRKRANLSLRSGATIPIYSLYDLQRMVSESAEYRIALMPQLKIHMTQYDILFNYMGKHIRLYHGGDHRRMMHALGAISEIFVDDVYGKLWLRGQTIVDIGANIGDSVIYFAAKGAKNIIAFEPFRSSFYIMRKNININRINNVKLINNAVLDKTKIIKIPNNGTYSSTVNSRGNTPTKVTTLKEITDNYDITDGILKIDTEGAEYDIILSQANDTLRKYRQIMIEYHYGYKNLEEKLKDAGFNVSHTRPKRISSNAMYIGMLSAERRKTEVKH